VEGYPEGLDSVELAFQRLYGPWKVSTPGDARRVLEGYDGVWWIAGGWAIEAFTGVRREPENADQIWLRQHALSAWEFDVVVNPDRDGRWVFRRDPSLDFALDEITWVAADGIRYLNVEVALAYKAKLARPKDEADLASALPALNGEQRRWLADMIDHLHPGHPWCERIR
jgi:hypothetical protein